MQKLLKTFFQVDRKSAALNTIVANSAMALYCAGYSEDLMTCKDAAEESINSGAALKKIKL